MNQFSDMLVKAVYVAIFAAPFVAVLIAICATLRTIFSEGSR